MGHQDLVDRWCLREGQYVFLPSVIMIHFFDRGLSRRLRYGFMAYQLLCSLGESLWVGSLLHKVAFRVWIVDVGMDE